MRLCSGLNVGFQIYINPSLCQVQFIRWRKNHKKSRINKKWHKRYGFISKCVNEKAFKMGNNLYLCPCLYEKMKFLTAKQ